MQRVDSFATHYYNWQLEKCVSQVTPESKRKLELMATNMTQEDVDILKSAETVASYEIENIDINGSEATVNIHVYDYYSAIEIDKPLQLTEQSRHSLHLVKSASTWKVEL